MKSARALATWNISGVDGTKPLAVTSVTPGNSKMGFIQASALKAGKVIAIASQAWTGNLNGCGEGKVTGATKTYLYKFYLTDNEIQKFDDPFSGGRAVGVSDETQRCLEIGSSPGIIDLPLDPENVIQHITVNGLNVGRNPQETLRILDALQTDELCPCNWTEGQDTLKPAATCAATVLATRSSTGTVAPGRTVRVGVLSVTVVVVTESSGLIVSVAIRPAAMTTIMVSPIARDTASNRPPAIPGIAAGISTLLIVSARVAPSA
jgi:hypothetical protein